MNYSDYIKRFNDYYKDYDDSVWHINMKYKHTFRVVSYAKRIAMSLNLSEADVDLACSCALFHDIARFSQWKNYQTYEDSKSFDHGDEGYRILKEIGIDDEIILKSTLYHNKFKIDEKLDDRTLMFCNITRDADKIDIMFEQVNEMKDEIYYMSDDLVSCFRNHEQLKNGMMPEDIYLFRILRCLAFIFDINFVESFKIIKDKKIIDFKCNKILEKFDEDVIKEIRDICNNYVDERIDSNVR